MLDGRRKTFDSRISSFTSSGMSPRARTSRSFSSAPRRWVRGSWRAATQLTTNNSHLALPYGCQWTSFAGDAHITKTPSYHWLSLFLSRSESLVSSSCSLSFSFNIQTGCQRARSSHASRYPWHPRSTLSSLEFAGDVHTTQSPITFLI